MPLGSRLDEPLAPRGVRHPRRATSRSEGGVHRMSETATEPVTDTGRAPQAGQGRDRRRDRVEARHRRGGVRLRVPRLDRRPSGPPARGTASERCRAQGLQEHPGPSRRPHGRRRRARGAPHRTVGDHVREGRHRRRRQGVARHGADEPAAGAEGWIPRGQAAVGRRHQVARRPAVPRRVAGDDRRSVPGATRQDGQPAPGAATQLRLRPRGADRRARWRAHGAGAARSRHRSPSPSPSRSRAEPAAARARARAGRPRRAEPEPEPEVAAASEPEPETRPSRGVAAEPEPEPSASTHPCNRTIDTTLF